MKVYDRIVQAEKDLSAAELVSLIANDNRQVDLIFSEAQTDEDGFMTFDAENWTSVDGKRFIRSYSFQGRILNEYSTYNKYDMKSAFYPENAEKIILN